jgi:hypothetical protein
VPKLVAYDADGNVIATLDYLVQQTEDGPRLKDFAAHQASGAKHTDHWFVEGAVWSEVSELDPNVAG